MRPGSWRGLPGRGRGVGKGAEAARARAAGGEAGAGPWGARSAAGKRWNGPSRHRTEGLRAPSTPLAHSGCDVRASLLARLPFDCRHCGASQATNGAKPPRAAPHPAALVHRHRPRLQLVGLQGIGREVADLQFCEMVDEVIVGHPERLEERDPCGRMGKVRLWVKRSTIGQFRRTCAWPQRRPCLSSLG